MLYYMIECSSFKNFSSPQLPLFTQPARERGFIHPMVNWLPEELLDIRPGSMDDLKWLTWRISKRKRGCLLQTVCRKYAILVVWLAIKKMITFNICGCNAYVPY